ncbi:site-specific integrase [Brevibacillus reuszeri]|uniref:site-specific integrase n=1 Tax=Brevibacillus reuszeri TaxID=54915 RepID=UPI000CCBFAAF|nr:site-specific integrase [Brevibacillus reuszeri]
MSVNPFKSNNLDEYQSYLLDLKLSEETVQYYIAEAKRFTEWLDKNSGHETFKSCLNDYNFYIENRFSKSVIPKKKSAINSFVEFLSNSNLNLIDNSIELKNPIIFPYTKKELEFLKAIMLAAGNNITRQRNLLVVELGLQGLSMKEITHIRVNQFDFEKNEIQLSDRCIKMLHAEQLLRYYKEWMAIIREENGGEISLLITPLHDVHKPLRSSVIHKWFELITQLGGVKVTLERLNLTFLHTLIVRGCTDIDLLSQLGPHLKKQLPVYIDIYRKQLREE